MISPALIDTDTLSAIMRRNPAALISARAYLAEHRRFSFSLFTRYEIMRGLAAKQAVSQITAFQRFCSACEILPIDDSIIVSAAEIYGDLRRRGDLIGDGDIIIAATAINHKLTVITNNENHFRRIHGLRLENWLKP